jgi:single-strand DNA-binding protein
MNSVTLIGRLTRDPELAGEGDRTVTRLRVAYDQFGKDRTGYVDVAAFGELGSNAAKYLNAGRQVAVTGRLRWRQWKDADQKGREALSIEAVSIDFLGKPERQNDQAA